MDYKQRYELWCQKVTDADIKKQLEEMKDDEVRALEKFTTGRLIKYKALGNHFDLLKL